MRLATNRDPQTPALVTEALSELPDRIRVGVYPLKIRVIPDKSEKRHAVWGTFSANDQTIYLNSEFPSLSFMATILIHEIVHAIWWAQGVSEDDDKEERIVTLIASGLSQVYRDNAWLSPWIEHCYRFDRAPDPATLVLPPKKAKAPAKKRAPKNGK